MATQLRDPSPRVNIPKRYAAKIAPTIRYSLRIGVIPQYNENLILINTLFYSMLNNRLQALFIQCSISTK